jgi:hypothetical protein
LKTILIPQSIKDLSKDWALGSLLVRVIFESALSLRVMIERGKVDLQQEFEIQFVECDCQLDFPGYSLETVRGTHDVFHIVER